MYISITANSRRICSNNGKVDYRHEIYPLQYLLQKNSCNLDNSCVRYSIEPVILRIRGKLYQEMKIRADFSNFFR